MDSLRKILSQWIQSLLLQHWFSYLLNKSKLPIKWEGLFEGTNSVSRNSYWQEAGNSGGVGGVVSYLGVIWQRDMLGGGREAPGSMVEANVDQKVAGWYVKRNFGGGKGVAMEIRQAWWEPRRQGRRWVRGWGRDWWVLGWWDGDRWTNDPVLLHSGSRHESGQGRVRALPSDGNQAEGGEGWIGLRRVE